MKNLLTLTLALACFTYSQAQVIDNEEKSGFQKENLFTGGSVSLSLGNKYFQAGISPVFGYSLTDWLDAGITLNYTYVSERDIVYLQDKARQNMYGGGPFVRVFPLRFIFLQGQFERNWISLKYFYPGGEQTEKYNRDANSALVGGGYTSGRNPGGGFFYMALLFDLMKDPDSPYRDQEGRTIPIIRAGVHIPLFGGL